MLVVGTLTAVAITGGMFVVPLYAFLTTTVTKDQTGTVAANNVVNSGAMVIGAIFVLITLTTMGVTPQDMMLVVAAMCPVAACWLAQRLHRLAD